MKKVEVTTKEQLDELYNQSALTFEGFEDSKENFDFLENWLKEHKAITGEPVANMILGKTMNKVYGLTGDNAYPDDLHIVAVTEIAFGPIVLARFQIGGRWFNDIVDNNARRG